MAAVQGAAVAKDRVAKSDRQRTVRAIVFGAIFAFMLLGPFYRQVLGKRHPLFRPWTMFVNTGVGLADVRFSQQLPGGERIALDHYSLLGYRDWRRAPLRVRRIMGVDGAQSVAAQICNALGPGADVRARVRVATRPGWRTAVVESDGNLCTATVVPVTNDAPAPAAD